MNVVQLRDYMAEKVIPEKVMPQNIAEFLMDEEAELPELNAFTFLNRLRSLGIGSADFLYLLEGCGAPAEAVERIRRNPAMNLQSLIITLDSSGLNSQDYTRMLYTARQMWERTLTMRLENVLPNVRPQEDISADTAEINFGEYQRESEPEADRKNRGAIPAAAVEAPPKAEEISAPIDDLSDYTSEMTAAETEEYPEPEEDTELLAAMAYYKSIFSPAGESGTSAGDNYSEIRSAKASGALPEPAPASDLDNAEEDIRAYEKPDGSEERFEAPREPYGEESSEEYPEADGEEAEVTSEFVRIDANQIMQELTSALDEDEDEDETQLAEPARMRQEGGYHKRSLISAAVGAAAVFGVRAVVSAMGF
ncbi:MAG: hypothetical protein K2G32_08635, partial [Oscillospiraceae bacterium]|nr:hypothetical protein [Oscillospiraceae bacterium]